MTNEWYITLGGTNLGDYGLVVTKPQIPMIPTARIDLQELGGTDGMAAQGSFWDERRFVLDCAAVPVSGSNLTNMRNIAAVLAGAQTTEQSLVFSWISDRSWNVRLVTGFNPEMYQTGATFQLEFVAPYPWAKATSESNDSNAFVGPDTWAWTPDGEKTVDAVWTIKNGGTEQTVITLQNTTTSESYALTAGLAADAWLKLDRANNWIPQISTDDGSNWANYRTGIIGVIPRVQGGVSNTIALSAIQAGSSVTLECDYYAEYWC